MCIRQSHELVPVSIKSQSRSERGPIGKTARCDADPCAGWNGSPEPGGAPRIPVRSVHVKVKLGDSLVDSRAQALTRAAMQTKLFLRLRAGRYSIPDSSEPPYLRRSHEESRDKFRRFLVGKNGLIVSVQVSLIDSAWVTCSSTKGDGSRPIRHIDFDSIIHDNSYRRRIIRGEANEGGPAVRQRVL